MIHELKGRCLFSPVRLINSLVRWVLGVHSPSGTIKVHNTANPSAGKSIGLDVDVNALETLLDKNAQTKSLNKVQRQAVRNVVRSLVDGVSLTWGDNCLSVNMSWIDSLINDKETGIEEDDVDQTTPVHIDTHNPSIVTPEPNIAEDSNHHSEALDTEWDRNTATAGVTVNVFSRQIVDTMGTVYWLYRPWTFDRQGRLVSIGAEVFGHDTMEGLQ